MASTFSYTFDLSSDKKVLKFRGDCGEEYAFIHELSWTIYGNSILNISAECSMERNVLIIAELHTDSANAFKTTALLEDGKAILHFQNVNFLTSDPWRCVIRVIPHLILHDYQESITAPFAITSIRKGPVRKSRLEQLSIDFQHLLETGEHSDVVLSDGVTKINAHKVILSARSPVFAKMFQHPMKENEENCVKIGDIPGETLKELVYFIYTGTTTLKDPKTACSLYIAADKYAVIDLRTLCSEVLQNVSVDDVLDILELADLYEDKILKQSALDFIVRNYPQLKTSKSWECFMKENQLLAIETLNYIIENKA